MQTFSMPTALCFGTDALNRLETLDAKRILLVTDPFFERNGTAARLATHCRNAKTEIFSGVQPDPDTQTIAAGVKRLNEFSPEAVVALGGGSAIDCAKAMLAMSDCAARLIAVPTSSGTGSEVTSFAVVTHEGVKYPLVEPHLRPELAILDDGLLASLPPALVADAGMDAVSHALEALAATGASVFSDAFALTALQTLLHELPRSFAGELPARAEVHRAATMAGAAFDNAGLGLCHALSHAIGGRFHVPHGRLNAVLLPHVIQFNLQSVPEIYRRAAVFCGLSGTQALRFCLKRLRARLKLPETLRACSIAPEALREASDAIISAALADPCAAANPRGATGTELLAVLEAAL